MQEQEKGSAMKIIAVSVFGMMLFLCGCGNTATNTHNKQSAKSTLDTSIILMPNASTYNLNKVAQGAVGFSALIENKDAETITIAHPSVCFPAEYRQGEVMSFGDSHGKSEILLKITKPNGKIVILRDGHHAFFDPGNIDHLLIAPGETERFYVGWFFQNARGRWENDSEAWKVFLSKGTYKVRILLRNTFPKASIYNKAAAKTRFVNVWTGEIQSEEVKVEIK